MAGRGQTAARESEPELVEGVGRWDREEHPWVQFLTLSIGMGIGSGR